MKKVYLLFAILSIAYSNFAMAEDKLLLKNGTLISGQVVEVIDSQKVVFKTVNGDVLTYPMIEVQKIAYEDDSIVMPKAENTNKYVDYSQLDKGFFIAPEVQASYSCLSENNMIGVELGVVGGYRFNEYLRVGLGLGARYYINDNVRYQNSLWAMPIYANIRGNIISMEHRHIIPYYSFDIGATIGDGFFFRPTIGLRFGEPRSAFLLGVTYWCQNIKFNSGRNKLTSFFGLKLGYEF